MWSHNTKTVITFAALVITTLISFFLVPISISYFGSEQYGLFALVGDVLAYLALSNLGIPNAVITSFANLTDIASKKKLIRHGLLISIVISILLLILLFIAYLFPNIIINALGKVPYTIVGTVTQFFIVSVLFFIIQLPLSVYGQLLVYSGYIHITKIISILISLCSLLILLVVIYFHLNIVSLVILNGIAGLCGSGATVILFYLKLNEGGCQPIHSHEFKDVSIKKLLKNSYFYFVNAIAGLLIMNTDNLVISHNLGLTEVAQYSIANKMVLLIISIMMQYLMVFVSEFPKHREQPEKTSAIVQTLLRRFCIASAIFAIGINLFLVKFIKIWTNNHIIISQELALFFSLYILCIGISQVPYYFLYSLDMIKSFYKFAIFEGVFNLILSLILVRHFGVAGVISATFIAHLCCSTIVFNVICYINFPKIFSIRLQRSVFIYSVIAFILIIITNNLFR